MKSTLLEQCTGKTLRGHVFHCSDQYLLLVWSDGCVTELCSEGDEDDSIVSQTSRWGELGLSGYDLDDLLEAGLDPDSIEGIKQANQAKLAEAANRNKEERRAEYERLKREFESGST